MLKTIIFLLVLAALVAAPVLWLRTVRQVVEVHSPVDRVYAYRKHRHRADSGYLLGLSSKPITGRGRTVGDKLHLRMGTHVFYRPVAVFRCTTGQNAIAFWSNDDVSWKPPKGVTAQGPIRVIAQDGTPAMVAIRISYSILDDPVKLQQITAPENFAERVTGDMLVAVREIISARPILDFATIERDDLSQQIFDDIEARIHKRGLVLKDIWLGHISVDADVLQALKDRAAATAMGDANVALARSRALTNRILAESVDDRLLALIRAERSGVIVGPWGTTPQPIDAEARPRALQR